MAHTRTDITQKGMDQTRDRAAYQKSKTNDAHKDLEVTNEKYLGLTVGSNFLVDVERWHAAYQSQMRQRPGKVAKITSLWPIVRQADGVTLSEERWKDIEKTVSLVLGPGAIAELVRHIPKKPKPNRNAVAGPEQNILVAGYRKLGPYFLPIRNRNRGLRRELIRAIDQLTRRWNQEKDVARIPEMEEVREAKRDGKAIPGENVKYRLLAQILADAEEERWVNAHPAPAVKDYIFPDLEVLTDVKAARLALEKQKYNIKVPAADSGKDKEPTPKAKLGFWRVSHPNWSDRWKEARKNWSKRAKLRTREPQCLIDGLRLIIEAREIFRERLRKLEIDRRCKLAKSKASAFKPRQPIAPPQPQPTPVALKLPDEVRPPDLQLTLPLRMIDALEHCGLAPFTTPEEVSKILSRIHASVYRPQADPDWLIVAGCKEKLPRNDALLSIQFALLRGAIRSAPGLSTQAHFYFGGERVAAQFHNFRAPALDPFAPCWREAFEALHDPSVMDAWYEALVEVTPPGTERRSDTPWENSVTFYQYLRGRAELPEPIAAALTAVHFRLPHGSPANFIAGLNFHLGLNKETEFKIHLPRAKADDPVKVLLPIPEPAPLHKGPPTPSPFDAAKLQKVKAPAPTTEQVPQYVTNRKGKKKKKAMENSPEWDRSYNPFYSEQPVEISADEMIGLALFEITGDEVPPRTVDQLRECLERSGEIRVERLENSGQTLVLRSAHNRGRVGLIEMKLAITLALIDAKLPNEASTRSKARLKFFDNSQPPPSSKDALTCERMSGLVDYAWPHIQSFIADEEKLRLWTHAFYRSRLRKEGRERAAILFDALVGCGLDSAAVHLLVLSQLRDQMSLVPAVTNHIRSDVRQARPNHDRKEGDQLISCALREVASSDPQPEGRGSP